MESTFAIGVEFMFIEHDDLDKTMNDTCGVLKQQKFTAVLDLTWAGWKSLRKKAEVSI